MRILHTSDWHLGRALCGERLLEDQCHVLAQLMQIVKDFQPDAVVVAGDVYDRAVPSPDEVELLDDVVSRLVLDCKTNLVLVAGNHDSGARLSFGARVLARNRLHVVGSLRGGPAVIHLPDEWGDVSVCVVPYTEPLLAACELDCPTICDHDTAMRAAVERLRFTILAAHTFISGAETSESERTLTVGGAGTVALDAVDGFSYVALGHLHQAQIVGRATVRYSGSILKYAFSEEHHRKQVDLISLDGEGRCEIESVALSSRRNVRTIQGTFDGLLRHSPGPERQDLVSITLLDAQPILDAKLHRVYRQPELERPRQRGSGKTIEKSKAVLWRRTGLGDDSESGQALAEGPADVTARVVGILSFTADQFRNVSVLPQGEFQKFLNAKSDERERILEVLFQTGRYRLIQETLKDRERQAKGAVQQQRLRREAVLQQAQLESEQQIIDRRAALEPQRTEQAERIEQLRVALRTAETALGAGRDADRAPIGPAGGQFVAAQDVGGSRTAIPGSSL